MLTYTVQNVIYEETEAQNKTVCLISLSLNIFVSFSVSLFPDNLFPEHHLRLFSEPHTNS